MTKRATWRAVAIPTEHGGWGLTLEPILLGLLVAWSLPGMALGVAALLAFLARTPIKVVLVDRYRHRRLDRTHLAARFAGVELAILAALIAVVAVTAPASTWVPLLLAAPAIAVELWFDMRSRSRRLAPELCGAVGIASVAAAIALAGGEEAAVAAGLWCVLAARSVASIPYVRHQIQRSRDRVGWPLGSDVAQAVAVVLAVVGWAIGWVPALGAIAIAVLAVFQVVDARLKLRPIKVVGVQQMLLGLFVVAMTAIGVAVG
ncbi:MAG: YwiC-like family protein [Ilumatobacteraceae bacterium]